MTDPYFTVSFILLAATLIGLASYRLWRLIAVDEITEGLRWRFLDRHIEPGRTRKWFAALVYCPWCLGWWLNVVAAIALILLIGWPWWPALFLIPAGSTVTGLLAKLDSQDDV